MTKTYKRKLILSREDELRFRSWIGACRYVYNMGLEIKTRGWNSLIKPPSSYDLMKEITEVRSLYEWLKDVPSQSLQAVMDRLDTSYKNFFRTCKKGGGFPKFASKRKYKSILFKRVKVEGNYVILPKIGRVKIFKDSEILGTPKTATIKIEPTGFFICIFCDDVPKKFESENQAVGLDMGITHFCIDNQGNFIANPRHFKKYEDKLRIENRSLARKKKGSESWKKQAKKVALLHHKIANVRKDFLHKESTRLAKMHDTVFMEKLNLNNMVRNPKLSKHILDCGWGMFRDMMKYKTTVIEIDPKYTSQTCHECGFKDAENRDKEEFECKKCGHKDHADVNAAKNIKSKGIALVRKREPVGCALDLEPANL